MYERDGNSWVQVARLYPPDGVVWDRLGNDLSIESGYFLAGKYGDDQVATNSGATYIYRKSSGSWEFAGILKGPTPYEGQTFGASVVAGQGAWVIGAPGHGVDHDLPGTAYVYNVGIFFDGFESGDILRWSTAAP